jgi:hypothetical protein
MLTGLEEVAKNPEKKKPAMGSPHKLDLSFLVLY